MIGSIVGSAIGAVGSGIIGAISNSAANAANVKSQERTNQQMLDYSKNAYSYAVADRMRAGLSPLDTSPAETPSLTAPQQNSVTDGSFANDAVQNALNFRETARVNDATISGANAKGLSDIANAQSTITDNTLRIMNAETELATARAQLQNAQDKHSEYSKTIELKVQKYEQEIDQLKEETDRVRQLISLTGENADYLRDVGLPVGTSTSLSGNALIGVAGGRALHNANAIKKSEEEMRAELNQDYEAFKSILKDRMRDLNKRRVSEHMSDEEFFAEQKELQRLDKLSFDDWWYEFRKGVYGVGDNKR